MVPSPDRLTITTRSERVNGLGSQNPGTENRSGRCDCPVVTRI